jgi:hypothetical protein
MAPGNLLYARINYRLITIIFFRLKVPDPALPVASSKLFEQACLVVSTLPIHSMPTPHILIEMHCDGIFGQVSMLSEKLHEIIPWNRIERAVVQNQVAQSKDFFDGMVE